MRQMPWNAAKAAVRNQDPRKPLPRVARPPRRQNQIPIVRLQRRLPEIGIQVIYGVLKSQKQIEFPQLAA